MDRAKTLAMNRLGRSATNLSLIAAESKTKEGGDKVHFIVPAGRRVSLAFFRQIYRKLQEDYIGPMSDEGDCEELSLLMFERTMTRLFRTVGSDIAFDPHAFDANNNGKVSWREFVMVWKQFQPEIHLSTTERVFLILEDPNSCSFAKVMSFLTLGMIVVSSTCFITSTVPKLGIKDCATCEPKTPEYFQNIDVFFITVFTIEFLVRMITASQLRIELTDENVLLEQICHENAPVTRSVIRKMLDWLFSPGNLIDLVAILPWYLTKVFEGVDASSLLILRMVRLGRVVRAFRLGRRFQAVIVIIRALKESQKVLTVLVFNVLLGTFIFGALMYFVEGGEWSEATGSYVRVEGYDADGTPIKGDTPYTSIPAAAWWALVTATTVGYGDHYPTTEGGKAVAALCMVWSLVVLALPIGVVGNTFGRVWDEYETERMQTATKAVDDKDLVKKSMHLIDPLYQSRQACIQIFHDGKTQTVDDDDAFLGEAEFELELRPDRSTANEVTVDLKPNRLKSRQIVSGTVSFSYKWKPHPNPPPGTILQGQLWFSLSCASGLPKLDWRQSLMPDAYAMIDFHPRANKNELTKTNKPHTVKTVTLDDSIEPTWKHDVTIDYLWQSSTEEELEDEIGKNNVLNEAFHLRGTRGDLGQISPHMQGNPDGPLAQVQEELRRLREDQILIKKEQREQRAELSAQLDSIKSLLQGLTTGATAGASVVPLSIQQRPSQDPVIKNGDGMSHIIPGMVPDSN